MTLNYDYEMSTFNLLCESNQVFGVLAGIKSPLDANSFSNLLPLFWDRSTLLILDDD